MSGWRTHIGNAVPVQAAAAIGQSVLKALLAARLGTWTLGGTGVWVKKEASSEAPTVEASPFPGLM